MNTGNRNYRRGAAGMLAAIMLLLIPLLPCYAEGTGRETLGRITANGQSWDVSLDIPAESYTLQLLMAQEDGIIADLIASEVTLPRMNLAIVRSEDWAEKEQLSDFSQKELQTIQDSYLIENDDPAFEDAETESGEAVMLVRTEAEKDIFLFTIRNGLEIELHLIAGTRESKLSEDDLANALSILEGLELAER